MGTKASFSNIHWLVREFILYAYWAISWLLLLVMYIYFSDGLNDSFSLFHTEYSTEVSVSYRETTVKDSFSHAFLNTFHV